MAIEKEHEYLRGERPSQDRAISTGATGQCSPAEAEQHKLRQLRDMLDDLFSYHPPRTDQLPRYQAIRSAARHFAEVVMQNTPASADQMAALRAIREATMTANAAIALDGRG